MGKEDIDLYEKEHKWKVMYVNTNLMKTGPHLFFTLQICHSFQCCIY